jgi:hypothetical protein
MIFLGDRDSPTNFFRRMLTFFIVLSVATFSGLFVYNRIIENPYMLKKYASTALQSPRAVLAEAADSYIEKKEDKGLPFLFGLGNKTYLTKLPLSLSTRRTKDKDLNEKTAEKDLTDLIGGYGRLFAYTIFLLPLLSFLRILKDFLLNSRSYLNFSSLIAISLFFIHAILAGHGIKNPEVGTLLAVIYVYVFNIKKFNRPVPKKSFLKSKLNVEF